MKVYVLESRQKIDYLKYIVFEEDVMALMIICDAKNHPIAISDNKGVFDPPISLTKGNYVVRSESGTWDIEVTDEVQIVSLEDKED
jgi:hypothetical protein